MKRLIAFATVLCMAASLLLPSASAAEPVNLAREGTATSSGATGGNGPGNAIDGDKGTRWYSKSSTASKVLQVDLAKNANITQIVIHENSVATPDYFDNMEYSLDGVTWMPAEIVSYTPKSATLGGKAGRERVYTLTPFAARSVRVTTPETPTKSSIGIYEFEVWGEYVGGFDARLSSLVPSFGELIPAFDPDVREYSITIESAEGGMPVMRAAAQDEEATVTVTDATEQSMQAVIDVTSANGEVNSQYVVTIISMSKNTELSKLELSGGALSESFDPEKTAYTCVVGEHDPLPSVVAEPLVSGAKVEVRQAHEGSMEAQVTVTSADGTQSRTYTVSFVRTGARLEAIYLNGIRMEEFSPDRLHYTFYYFIEDDLPDITFDKMYENASAELTQPTANQSLIRVTSLAGEVREYTISFIKRSRAMDDASLCAVTIEGKLIDGFRPDQYEYLIYVESGLTTPVIEAIPTSENATAEITQASVRLMTATIEVVSGDGAKTNTYTIHIAKNIALGKNSKCSTSYSSTASRKAFDNDINTYWGASNGTAEEWVFVDLESVSDVYKIVVKENLSASLNFYNTIKYSDDGNNWTTLPVQLSIIDQQPLGGNTLYTIEYTHEPFRARFVRLSGSKPAKLRVQEFEVYGISEPVISSNTYLKEVKLSSGHSFAEFDKYTTNYTISLSATEEIPLITEAIPEDAEASVSIKQATAGDLKAEITVTAANGISKRVYTITYIKAVSPLENANLASLTLSFGSLTPEFAADVTNYVVAIPQGAPLPTVSAAAEISGALVTVTQADESGMKAVAHVTATGGAAQRTYTVSFVRKSANLKELSVSGYNLQFDNATSSYTVELPAGTALPEVSAVLEDDTSTLVVTQATAATMKATVTVTTSGGELTKVFTIHFQYMKSLEEALSAASAAVKNLTVSNDTTAAEIMEAVEKAVGSDKISISWKQAFAKTKATSSKSGSIVGEILLAFGEESTVLKVNKTISKLSVPSSGGGGGGGGRPSAAITPPYQPEDADPDTAEPPEDSKELLKESLKGHWGEREISELIDKGVVQGSDEGLALEENVTRAEFLVLLMRAIGIEPMAFAGGFQDVSADDWFAGYLQAGYSKGYMEGSDGFLKPNDAITREEAAKIIVSVYEDRNAADGEFSAGAFTDYGEISWWAQSYVDKAVGLGLIQGYSDGSFGPKQALKREQAMVLCYRIMG